jgi:hypothetical protein
VSLIFDCFAMTSQHSCVQGSFIGPLDTPLPPEKRTNLALELARAAFNDFSG